MIFGLHKRIGSTQGNLIHVDNIKKDAYLLFDELTALDGTDEVKQYMLGVIANSISYFNSLKIKEILIKISDIFKDKKKVDCQLTQSWKLIQENLALSI
jgi:hypothetical protein